MVIDATTAWTLRDDGPTYKVGEQMGWSVAVGDFNGDGYADVLTGAPSWGYGTHTSIGYAYVYYGPFTADKTTPDVRLNGTTDGGSFGYAVAAGKFNNDNYWDVLVARHSILSNAGPVCIFYGSSSWSGTFSTCDVKFEPPSDFNNYGVSVAAGNVDNAYYDDVLVGSSGHDNDNNGLPGDGVVYVYKSPYSSGADISTANYTLYPSSNSSGQLGKSLAVGPVDSDAYQDVVAGEPAYTVSGCGGRFQFYKGINLASGSGNRFPNATVTAPSSGCGSAAWQFGSSIALGKLNSDNYLDVIVGAPTKGTSNGAALLYLANSGGSGLTTGASPDITINNQQNGERFGTSVAIADLTDDNIGDAIVGAPFYDTGGSTLTGRVYWFNNPLVDQTPDATWTGAQNAERFGQSLAVGKFSSDVRQQIAIGAYLWDKNSGNPNDNDGRVVVAAMPEAPVLFLFAVPIVVVLIRSRRRSPRHSQ